MKINQREIEVGKVEERDDLMRKFNWILKGVGTCLNLFEV